MFWPNTLPSCISVKTFGFILYTSTPHSKIKDRLNELVQLWLIKQRRYKYLVSGRGKLYFVKQHSDSTKKFSETDIFKMREFLMVDVFLDRRSGYLYGIYEN